MGFNAALGYGFQTYKFDRVLKTKGPPKRLAAIQYTSYIDIYRCSHTQANFQQHASLQNRQGLFFTSSFKVRACGCVCVKYCTVSKGGGCVAKQKMLHEATIAVMAGDSLMRKRSRGKQGRLTGYSGSKTRFGTSSNTKWYRQTVETEEC